MLKHEQVMASVIVEHRDEYRLIVQADVIDGTFESKPSPVVFNKNDVLPEAVNILHASTLMYQQLTNQYLGLQSLIEEAERQKVEWLISVLLDMQTGILVIQRAAIEGVTKIGLELDRERGIKND